MTLRFSVHFKCSSTKSTHSYWKWSVVVVRWIFARCDNELPEKRKEWFKPRNQTWATAVSFLEALKSWMDSYPQICSKCGSFWHPFCMHCMCEWEGDVPCPRSVFPFTVAPMACLAMLFHVQSEVLVTRMGMKVRYAMPELRQTWTLYLLHILTLFTHWWLNTKDPMGLKEKKWKTVKSLSRVWLFATP